MQRQVREKTEIMENGGNMFMGNRGHAGHNSNINLVWDIRQLNPTATTPTTTTTTSIFDWAGSTNHTKAFNLHATTSTTSTAAIRAETTSSSSALHQANTAHALMFLPHNSNASLAHHLNHKHSLYIGDGSHHMHADPNLVCLKLGKRQYFEDSSVLTEQHLSGGLSIGKKGKPYNNNLGGGCGSLSGSSAGVGPSSSTGVMGPLATAPRCQVEGCNVALVNAKDYHRRHKVCEVHSKAPKVVVLGLEQRFCQQCSRFHVVSEFDDSKRSCRRRLAGHNERRRKSSHDSATRNSAQDGRSMTGRFPYLSSPTGCALSLLSSRADSWISPSDLSSRSSAALWELIAENRAAILARQLILDRDCHLHQHAMEELGDAQPGSSSIAVQQQTSLPEAHGWDKFPGTGAQVTLDFMQSSSPAFGMLNVREKAKEEEEECSELWNSLEGTHVV